MGGLALGRVLTAMVTPFTDNLEVDYRGAAKLARHLLDNGTDTVVAGATTGEAPTLSSEEKLRLFETIKNEKVSYKVIGRLMQFFAPMM